jgi:hypothetical protein
MTQISTSAISSASVPSAAPSGGTGANLGGWDSANNRNTAIDCINGVRTCVGEIKLEIASLRTYIANKTNLRTEPLPTTLISTATPAVAAANGTGIAAGCYDTSNNRDAALTTTNSLRTCLSEIKSELALAFSAFAWSANVLNLRTEPYPTTLIATATPAAAPAGGTGATAGGMDTDAHNDDWVATINGLRDLVIAAKTDINYIRAFLAD